jgi:hypothetical protein
MFRPLRHKRDGGNFQVGMLGQYMEAMQSVLISLHLPGLSSLLLARCTALAFTQTYYGLGSVYFFLLGSQASENSLVATLAPKRLHHSAFGMKFILTFGVGALAVKILGWIDTIWGSEATFIALGINSALLVGTIVLLILRTNRSVLTLS